MDAAEQTVSITIDVPLSILMEEVTRGKVEKDEEGSVAHFEFCDFKGCRVDDYEAGLEDIIQAQLVAEQSAYRGQ